MNPQSPTTTPLRPLHESLLGPSDICFVRAMYPFSSEEPSSLAFVPGDLIRVLTKLDSGWWDGLLHGRRGWFPSNYVEEVEVVSSDDEEDPVHNQSNVRDIRDIGDSSDASSEHTETHVQSRSSKSDHNPDAAFWIPQTTIEGRIFYFNTKTGISKWNIPFVPLESIMVDSKVAVGRVTPITTRVRPPLDEPEEDFSRDTSDIFFNTFQDPRASQLCGGWRDVDGNDILEEESSEAEKAGEVLLFAVPGIGADPHVNGLQSPAYTESQDESSRRSGLAMSASMSDMSESRISRSIPGELLSQTSGPAPGLGIWEQQLSLKSDALIAATQSRKQETYQSICEASRSIVSEMLQSLGLTKYSSSAHSSENSDEESRSQKPSWVAHYRKILAATSKLMLSAHLASNPWAAEGAQQNMLDDSRNLLSTVSAFLVEARQAAIQSASIKPTVFADRTVGGGWNGNSLSLTNLKTPIGKFAHAGKCLSLSPESISIIENLAMSVHAGVRLCKAKVRQFQKEPKMSTASIIVRDTTEVLHALKQVLANCEQLDLSVLNPAENNLVGQSPTIVDFSKSKQSIYDAAGNIILAAQAITHSSVMRGVGFSEQLNAVKFISKSYGELETALQATIMHAEFMVQELVSRYSQGPQNFVAPESAGAKRDGKMKKLLGDDAPDSPTMTLAQNTSSLSLQKSGVPGTPRPEQTPWFLDHELESDLSYDANGNVKAGTLLALVERLTRHDLLDSVYNNTFLLTYQSFTTAQDLSSLLIQRYLIEPPAGLTPGQFELWVEKKQNPIRLRVFKILKSWMESFFMEPPTVATREWLTKTKDFVQNVLSTHIGGGPVLVKLIEKRIVHGDVPFRKMIPNALNPAPAPILPRNLKKVRLLDLDPLEVARQITILESNLYCKIKPRECLDKSWSKAPGTTADTNIRDMIEHSNRITAWVAEAILYQTDLKKRVSLIKHFVTIAEKCRVLNNFSTVTAIISGLNSAPIHRLRRTWDLLNARVAMSAEDLNRLMTSSKNFSIYRETLHQMQPPCVPFLGVYLTDLTFIEDGNPDMSVKAHHLINISKRRKTADVIRDIQQYQAVPYALTPVPEIQEYIQNCMDITRDVNELYTVSLQREPREREDEKIARLLQESGFL